MTASPGETEPPAHCCPYCEATSPIYHVIHVKERIEVLFDAVGRWEIVEDAVAQQEGAEGGFECGACGEDFNRPGVAGGGSPPASNVRA